MRLPVLVAIIFASLVITLAKGDKERQVYSSPLDSHSLSSSQQQHSYKSPSHISLSTSSSASGGGYGSAGSSSAELSTDQGSRNNGGVSSGYDTPKNFGGQSAFSSASSSSLGSSLEFGGTAEGTGAFHSIFPGSASVGGGGYPSSSSGVVGGYPSSSVSGGGYPASALVSGGYPSSSSSISHKPVDHHHPVQGQPHGPAYTYYYQHYPTSSVQGGGWSEGGDSDAGLFGDIGGGGGGLAGGGGIAGIGGVAGLAVLKAAAAVAKGLLVVKPFIILGLLFLIAFPILLLFFPLPIITITGGTGIGTTEPSGGNRKGRSSPSVVSYLANLSEKVLTADECLERFICKIPQVPESYKKKVKSLWDQYGLEKYPRVSRGLEAYFDNSSSKNRNFKCNQRFQCSNKFI